VLCGLVVALLAPGALVACGDNSSSNSGSGSGNGGGAGSTGTGSGGTGGGAASGAKLAALADVPQGSGLVVNKPGGSGKILIVRPSGDTVKAFNAACKHQGTIVAPPVSGTITCPAHGSQYDAATGALKKGPAKSGLDEVSVKVQGSDIVLA
jgi:Rieske Fe-S protein